MSYTKGPWRIGADGINVGEESWFKPFGGCGCCGSPWMNGDDTMANARLISAAPDMAEALRDLLDAFPGGDVTGAKERARAALAKAGL